MADSKFKNDPYWKEVDAISCPECASLPADSRVVAVVDLGAGIRSQSIRCDQCQIIYEVVSTA